MLAAGIAGCGDEVPTDVGAGLLGPGVRTFEVTFEASEFLVGDTTFDQIGSLNDAEFRMAAHEFDGEVDARTLFSLLRPLTASFTEGGQTQVDSIEAIVGGRFILVVDTIASSPGPIDLEVVQVTESWHRPSATWTIRTDTAGVTETWETAGGSPGEVLAAATWTAGDTLEIALDSATVAVWDDTTTARLGGLVRTATPDSRIFFRSVAFAYDVRPVSFDTIVPAGGIAESKIIVTPESAVEPLPGVLRVGGLPAWRSMLRFQPLSELRIPCGPGQPVGCTLALEDVSVNLASLILEPVSAGPRRTERPVRLEARAVMEGAGVPIIRSPLTPPLGPPSDSLAPALFAPAAADPAGVRLSITGFVRFNLEPDEDVQPPRWVAVTAVGERGQFGYTAFGGVESDRPPRLLLMVSVPDEVLIR